MSISLTGNRALVYVKGNLVGIFDSVNYTTAIGTDPIFILGASAAQEIAITSQEVINLNCSGFRVVGFGLTTLPGVPQLADLMGFEALTITIVDRQTGATVLTALGCVPNNYGTNFNAKQTSKISVSYVGVTSYDEAGNSSESGAASLPV